MSPATVAADALLAFLSTLFATHGVPADDARLVADSIVQAELWGHPSHGALRASWYLARLKSGAIRTASATRFVVDAGAAAGLAVPWARS